MMASDPVAYLMQAAQNGNEETLFSQHISHAIQDAVLASPRFASEQSLVEIANFLARATSILSRVAFRLVDGQHIDLYIDQIIESLEEEDMSELGPLRVLSESHKSLKYDLSLIAASPTILHA